MRSAFACSVTLASIVATGAARISKSARHYGDVEVALEEHFQRRRGGADDGKVGFDDSPDPGIVGGPAHVVSLFEDDVEIVYPKNAGHAEARCADMN